MSHWTSVNMFLRNKIRLCQPILRYRRRFSDPAVYHSNRLVLVPFLNHIWKYSLFILLPIPHQQLAFYSLTFFVLFPVDDDSWADLPISDSFDWSTRIISANIYRHLDVLNLPFGLHDADRRAHANFSLETVVSLLKRGYHGSRK